MPSLSRGAQGVRPGLSSPRAPALARVSGQRHQEAWAPGTEEDGSVTRKDGSGWAQTVSRDNLEGAGVQANGLPEGAWRWGGSDQEHQYCSRWGSHLGVTRFPSCARRLGCSVSPGGFRRAVLESEFGLGALIGSQELEKGGRDKSLALGWGCSSNRVLCLAVGSISSVTFLASPQLAVG